MRGIARRRVPGGHSLISQRRLWVLPRQALSPGAALFPSGRAVDRLMTSAGEIQATAANASMPCVFVRAEEVGLSADLPPDAIEANVGAMALLEEILLGAAPGVVTVGALLSGPPENPLVEASLRTPMICASVKRRRFMLWSSR